MTSIKYWQDQTFQARNINKQQAERIEQLTKDVARKDADVQALAKDMLSQIEDTNAVERKNRELTSEKDHVVGLFRDAATERDNERRLRLNLEENNKELRQRVDELESIERHAGHAWAMEYDMGKAAQAKCRELEAELTKRIDMINELRVEKVTLTNELKETRRTVNNQKGRINQIEAVNLEQGQKYAKDIKEIEGELIDARVARRNLRKSCEHWEGMRDAAVDELKVERTRRQEAEKRLLTMNEDLIKAERQNEDFEATLDHYKDDLQRANDYGDSQKNEVERYKALNAKLASEKTDLKRALDELGFSLKRTPIKAHKEPIGYVIEDDLVDHPANKGWVKLNPNIVVEDEITFPAQDPETWLERQKHFQNDWQLRLKSLVDEQIKKTLAVGLDFPGWIKREEGDETKHWWHSDLVAEGQKKRHLFQREVVKVDADGMVSVFGVPMDSFSHWGIHPEPAPAYEYAVGPVVEFVDMSKGYSATREPDDIDDDIPFILISLHEMNRLAELYDVELTGVASRGETVYKTVQIGEWEYTPQFDQNGECTGYHETEIDPDETE